MVKPAKYRGWHKTKSEQRRFSHTKFNSQFGLFFLSSTKRQFEHFKKVDFMKSLEFIMMLQSTIQKENDIFDATLQIFRQINVNAIFVMMRWFHGKILSEN